MEIRESLSGRYPRWLIPLGVVVGAFLNAYLGIMDEAGIHPFFLDSVFTAIGAAMFGPTVGSACAILTSFFSEAIFGFEGLNYPFALCGIALAVIVGLFANNGLFSTFSEVLVCYVIVSLIDSVLGALISTFILKGNVACDVDYYAASLKASGMSALEASIWARILIDLIDKGISVFIAFLCLRAISKSGIPPERS
jgi:hypothetical protein